MLGWFKRKKKKNVSGEETLPVGEAPAEAEAEEEEGAAPEAAVAAEPLKGNIPAAEPGKREAGQAQQKTAAPRKNNSLFARLQAGLDKTRKSLVYRLDTLFLGKKVIDQELYDDIEEILITADLGVGIVQHLLDEVRVEVNRAALKDPQALKSVLAGKIRGCLLEQEHNAELEMPASGPLVIMVVGVNGVGKTTSIGKIAAKFVRSGKTVLLAAADTFRAAAIDQLKIWGERNGVEVVAHHPGADPSSVAYDAIEVGVARGYDVIIVDTAGRLHTQVNLMEELKKIKRVIGKKLDGAPHEVMLVIDATTGQNGISQARIFNEAVGVTGVTLTKLDGTAKGGIVINICRELGIPVRFIGIGEQIDDLRDFNANEFVNALFDK